MGETNPCEKAALESAVKRQLERTYVQKNSLERSEA